MAGLFRKVFAPVFLATVALAMSDLLHSAPLPISMPSNNRVFSDSLKRDTPVVAIDSVVHAADTLQHALLKDSTLKKDSIVFSLADTLHKKDSLGNTTADESEIQDVINYKADDSIVYDLNTKKMMLYNNVDVKYQKIKLDANSVNFDWTTYTLSAQGTEDTAGKLAGTPTFTEDGKDYKAKRMAYNFRTKRGIIYEVVTKEGDSYIHSEMVKKNEDESWFGKYSEYTTCDLDHPHYYFKAKRVKIIPEKVMVTGPANLWVGDVPTPIYLPFGIFPIKESQRSGIILPEYGQDAVLGFFVRNGGYYWAMNDYVGMKFTGEITTNGTWGLTLATQYALRYKFSGSFSFSILRSRPDDPDLPGAKSTNAYSFSWSHTEDPKSMPNSTFGASVNMQSSDFYQASRVTDTRLLNTDFNSTIQFSHNFVGTPFSLSINLRHDQNLLTHSIDFTLPTLRLSMSRYAPFKSKVQSTKPKWYESIGLAYSFEFQNQLNTIDSQLFTQASLKRFTMGVDQNIAIDAPVKVFKYFTLTPGFQYQERTYFKGQTQSWDPDTTYINNGGGPLAPEYGHIAADTFWHFHSVRDFNASVSFGTKVTGIYKFKGKYLKALKHVFTPSISGNYHPDFGAPMWGYYKTVQYDAKGDVQLYPVLDPSAIYGVPGVGKLGSVNWSLGNNFEMKTYSKTDSTGNHEKKMGLLDQVNISGGYNFAADSLRLLPFQLAVVSAKFFNLINLAANANFDPYASDSMNNDINIYEWTLHHRLLRFSNANISATLNLHSKQVASTPSTAPPKFIADYVSYNPDQIYNFNIPWSFSLSYHFNVTHGTYLNPDTIVTVQTVSAQFDFNITSHWKVNVTTGYDITHRQVTLTNISVVRDLHCWELSFHWTPALPTFTSQQFSIILQPKSPTLRDLKVQKKNSLSPSY